MTSSPLRCPACAAELPSAFPGASVACVCGHRTEIAGGDASTRARGAGGGRSPSPASAHAHAHARDPYRAPAPAPEPAPSSACPFCGNECPPMVRICPHCDVRLENVRCQRCFSLQPPGTFVCVRCACPLELEPLLDATDAPCPRCTHPLEVAPGADKRTHECPRCGGMFVPRDVFAEIMVAAEIGGALREDAAKARDATRRSPSQPGPLGEVRYLPCPLCHSSMNRVNFGKVSGVIVDVCRAHGTWFDAGELTRVVAFAAAGGLERTRERESEEQRSEAARARGDKAQAAAGAFLDSGRGSAPRVDEWRDLLRRIFSW